MRRAGPRLRAQIGFVSHEPMLYPDLTAGENLRFHAASSACPTPTTRLAEVAALLDVGHVLDRPVRTLSRGTTQRVALARALVHRPRRAAPGRAVHGARRGGRAGARAELLDELHDARARADGHPARRRRGRLGGPERLLVLSRGRVALDEPMRDAVGDLAEEYLGLLRPEVAA